MRYSKMLKKGLGVLIYGIAQVYDERLSEVFLEARRILNETHLPQELFEGEA